jgi:SAM-dependent methyltransferase
MSETEVTGLSPEAARVYDDVFVPAMFAEWADRVAEAAQLAPGDAVLDVACGTGVLSRAALARLRADGQVTGLDSSSGMLAVAAQRAPQVTWRQGLAESLPFPDGSFDAVVSQFGLMFFTDRVGALREMWRVLRPQGRLAVAVWDRLDHTPAYVDFVALLARLFGAEVADGLRAPFALGDSVALLELFASAGARDAKLATASGTVRFPSLEAWIEADGRGWLQLDDAKFEALLAGARHSLARYAAADGKVAFAMPAHVVTATKPPR